MLLIDNATVLYDFFMALGWSSQIAIFLDLRLLNSSRHILDGQTTSHIPKANKTILSCRCMDATPRAQALSDRWLWGVRGWAYLWHAIWSAYRHARCWSVTSENDGRRVRKFSGWHTAYVKCVTHRSHWLMLASITYVVNIVHTLKQINRSAC